MAKAPPPKDAGPQGAENDPVIIKKYANRRLYNTETSSYITLEHIAQMTREGRHFQVFDARTGDDITRSVLTQIVMEEESGGQTMLPVNFLRQLISMYGDSMQSMVPHYLEASMEAFTENQTKFRDAALKPFEQLARQNMALFEAAAAMMTGGIARPAAAADAPSAPEPAPRPAPHSAPQPAPQSAQQPMNASETELARVKAELAALQAQLDGLTRQ